MLTITYTHVEGTLIEGTSKGDGTAEVLKANGWRWGRSIGACYIPFSRDQLPKNHIITRTCDALRAVGFEVDMQIDRTHRPTAEVEADMQIDRTHRPTAEVEADKFIRQTGRVDALEAKAARLSAAENAAWEREHAALERLPFGGEPIKIGHHYEHRARAGHMRRLGTLQ